MPNDAKLGLVVGMAIVIAVAVIFYRKDAPAANPAAIDKAPAVAPSPAGRNSSSTLARASGMRRYTVQAGESLASIAKFALGSTEKAGDIRELNRDQLQGREEPAPGTVLILPAEEGQ